MAVTETKIIETLEYTKNQIKHRRVHNWERGVHYWSDAGNATVYSLEAITQWQSSTQQVSMTDVENAKSGGWKEKLESTKRSPSHIRQLT